MAKAFSLASWNVEHFGATDKNHKNPKKPIAPIIDYLARQKADVVGVYEVVSSVVYDTVIKKMPDYNWHITEGPQTQEILVGVKRKFQSFFRQYAQFQSGQPTLRPGALLTLHIDNRKYPLLFLHLKSMSDPKGFGLRDDQTERALKFRTKLDEKSGDSNANYIFLGDLNTMGMNLSYNPKDILAAEEIDRLKKRVARKNMAVLAKAGPTYWPGSQSSYSPGELDHVVAADHLTFKSFNGHPVDIRGWPQESTDAKKDAWAKKYSDHALLYLEVQKS